MPLPSFQPGERAQFLLVGQDSGQEGEQTNSDAILLLSVDPQTENVKLLSFLRNLYVPIPGMGMGTLADAYKEGGIQLLTETLEENFELDITGSITLGLAAAIQLVDQMGGVTLPLSQRDQTQLNAMLVYENQLAGNPESQDLVEATGSVLLNGRQALGYGRIQRMDGDFQRALRQHKLLEALRTQARAMGLEALAAIAATDWRLVQSTIEQEDLLAYLPTLLATSSPIDAMYIPMDHTYYDDVAGGQMVLNPDLEKNKQGIQAFLEE